MGLEFNGLEYDVAFGAVKKIEDSPKADRKCNHYRDMRYQKAESARNKALGGRWLRLRSSRRSECYVFPSYPKRPNCARWVSPTASVPPAGLGVGGFVVVIDQIRVGQGAAEQAVVGDLDHLGDAAKLLGSLLRR